MNLSKRFHLALGVCISLAAAVVAWGQAPGAKVVYVATGANQVFAVPVDGSAATPLIPASDVISGAEYTSLTVGPDNTSGNTTNADFFLYACDKTNDLIVRLQLPTGPLGSTSPAAAVDTVYNSVAPLTAPVCGRVDSEGDLYVSSATPGDGVYVITGASTTAVGGTFNAPATVYGETVVGSSFTGGGITQKNNGDMLIVDSAGGKILRASFVGAIPANAPYSPFSSTLDTSYASDNGSPTAIARISTNDFFVANQGSGSVERFDPANVSLPTTCSVSIPNNATVSSLAASEDNFVYVGIASNSPHSQAILVLDGTATNCGAVGSAISLSSLPSNESAKTVAAVAVPPVPLTVTPTSQSDPAITGDTLWTFKFGNSEIQTVTPGCTPQIELSQVSVPYLQNLTPLTGTAPDGTINFTNGAPVPFNGEGGFGTKYKVVNAGTAPGQCEPDPNAYNNFVLGAFDDTTLYANSRIIHCDPAVASPTGCEVDETSGFWPESVGGLLSGDITIGGKVPGFSKFFLANGELGATGAETGAFCGFGSPLTNSSPYASFNSGQNLSVKFEIGAGGSCSTGKYITDAVALLSVAQVTNTNGTGTLSPVTVESSGNSTEVSPIITYSPKNKQYQFSLSLKGYSAGTYALVVTFLSNTTVSTLAAPAGGVTYVVTYFTVQ